MIEFLGSAEDVRRAAMGFARPPPKRTLSQWADAEFYLSSESSAQAGKWKTIPYQREPMDAMSDPHVWRVTFKKSARVGYALALDTPIPTPSGWSTMGALTEGDFVLGSDGAPVRVAFKSPVYVDHECYRVTFCDGSTIIADAGHRWFVESDVGLDHLIAGRSGRTGRPKPGALPIRRAGVVTTEEMARAVRTSRGRNALAVPNADALDLPAVDLPVPPYMLGLWLGDGHCCSPRITQHYADVETAAWIEREGVKVTVARAHKTCPNNLTYYLDCVGGRDDPSPWVGPLERLGVLSPETINKHIPGIYLRASFEQRLELLRGLMDSDGTVGGDSRVEFNNTNRRLALGVYELVVSLGMKATVSERPPKKAPHLLQYRVNFRPVPEMNPFHLARKAARVRPLDRPTINRRRRVVSVERVATVPVQCITVDAPNALFLAGTQMVPTHNSKMILAKIAYNMDQDPCSQMIVQPTEQDGKGWSKEELLPALRDVPCLARIETETEEEAPARGSGQGGQTMTHRRYPGGVLSIAGANSGAGFRRISRRDVLFDEVDGYKPSAGKDGDQIKLGIKRTEGFHNRKVIDGSTPLIHATSKIEPAFMEGTQEYYHVPCPQCGHMAPLVFKKDGDGHRMRFDMDRPHDAFFECQKNGCVIEHKDKRWMIERGQWVAKNPGAARDASGRLHRSFHIWTAYSYLPNATWGHIAEEFVKAKKMKDPEKLKEFVNTTLGETWKEKIGDAPDWHGLYNRRSSRPMGTVPDWVRFITAGVDVQADRAVCIATGWGMGKESQVVDYRVIPLNPGNPKDWEKLTEWRAGTYLSDNGVEIPIACLAIDSGAFTQAVYDWARQFAGTQVIAIKGVPTARAILDGSSPVDLKINGKRSGRSYRVWNVGGHHAKDELYGFLKLALPVDDEPYPSGFVHFCDGLPGEFFEQLTGEHKVKTKDKRGFDVVAWELLPGRENHVLDAWVYARAAASLLGLERMVRRSEPPPKPAPAPKSVAPKPQSAPAPSAQSKPASAFGPKAKNWLHRG